MKSSNAQSVIKFPESIKTEELQLILSSLSGTGNQLNDDLWRFESSSVAATIDVGSLQDLKSSYPDWCNRLKIDLGSLVKILFLHSVKGIKNVGSYWSCYETLVKTLYYLAENEKTLINQSDLISYFSYLMMHSLEANKLVKRLVPLSYRRFSLGLDISNWVMTLKRLELNQIDFASSISGRVVDRELRKTIEVLFDGDMTYTDWKEGGNLDCLTLDYGRYYVEYCNDFFDRHIALATALSQTLSDIESIVKSASVYRSKQEKIKIITPIVGNFLRGIAPQDLPISYRKSHSDNWLKNLQSATLDTFKKHYRPLRVREILLGNEQVEQLAEKLNLFKLDANQRDFLKRIINTRLQTLEPKVFQANKDEVELEKEWLADAVALELDINVLNEMVDAEWKRLNENIVLDLPKISFYQGLGISLNSSTKTNWLSEFIGLVSDSGVIKVVALTGWRPSEYGFSMKDIKISQNRDLLDQKTCPIRYVVHWIVPKTNGDTKLGREITYTTYQSLKQMSQLVNAGVTKPCLYTFNGNTIDPTNSSKFIAREVAGLWGYFVRHYKPFLQLDSLEKLKELETQKLQSSLSISDAKKLRRLIKQSAEEKWDELDNDPLLREARRRSRDELARVEFYLNYAERKFMVWEYCIGTLKTQQKKLLDTYLSPETKEAIFALTCESDVPSTYTRAVASEVVEGCLYPTPLAFRHMWVEAVYRRFDGDVGWMIRSMFKHITQRMWLSYIRNKDNRRQHDRVKRQIVSSILANYLRKKGKGYSGAMDIMLRRLFIKTKAVDLDQMAAIEEYSQVEIEDIKANPWGYCILRRRNQHLTKCAEEGAPQRHNASPALCLGCINNLTQGGNVEGIFLGISNDLKVLQSLDVPKGFFDASFNTVSAALKQLKNLNAGSDILDELEVALEAGSKRKKL